MQSSPSIWQRLRDLNDFIEGCWIGDAIGVVALMALFYMGMWITAVFQ